MKDDDDDDDDDNNNSHRHYLYFYSKWSREGKRDCQLYRHRDRVA
jgi:hypothetical protein